MSDKTPTPRQKLLGMITGYWTGVTRSMSPPS